MGRVKAPNVRKTKPVKSNINTVKAKIKSEIDGRGRGKAQVLKLKKQALDARGTKVKTMRSQLTKSRVPEVTSVRTVPTGTGPTVRGGGNTARSVLQATKKRVQTTNFGISGQSPLN